MDTSDADSFSSSEDEKEVMRRDAREDIVRSKGTNKKVAAEDDHNETELQTLRDDTIDTSRNSGMTFNEEVEHMKKENIKNLQKAVENEKDPYRRGIYHPENKGITGIIANQIDRGVKEKRGRKEEIKILETRNKQRIEREVLAIRKFLKMDNSTFKIHDQRKSRMIGDKID